MTNQDLVAINIPEQHQRKTEESDIFQHHLSAPVSLATHRQFCIRHPHFLPSYTTPATKDILIFLHKV